MHFYGMSWPEVLKLPMNVFWCLNKQVSRLRAESDVRLLRVYQSAQAGDAARMLQSELVDEVGKITVDKPKADVEAMQRLMDLNNRSKTRA